ncbi:MFS transporter [Streptomyces sp. PCS3-D2]|uniref:MFS transporter n=1 Tax=Streptomyces sp. PCS3-D2 TaxID=1460244 RepID=UPI0004455261|nr:MFS transporter [Streptomyces sp. PCS3-D2]WKV73231.1 MFS transporter [Streptomyces sp. PCS3-D2]
MTPKPVNATTATTAATATTATTTATATKPAPGTAPVPVLWLALLATPVAATANAPVLILPDMAASLGVDTSTAARLVAAFAWAMAVSVPLLAGLLRRRGLTPVLRLSTALLLGGTLLVAASPWLAAVLLGRAAQAVGGAGLVAAAMSLAGSARRMGVISAGFGMLGASGPLLGAQLSHTVSWRLSLSVSLVSLLAVPAVSRYAQAPAAAPQGRFDTRGAALLAVLATALVLLPHAPAAALGSAAIAAGLLTLHMRRRPDGFVPAALVRSRLFLGSALLACALSTSYFTLLFAVPRLLTDRAGWDVTAAGTGQLVTLLTGSALSWLLAAGSARMGRTAVRAVLVSVGTLAVVLAVFGSSGPLLLAATLGGVFGAAGASAVLSVQAASSAPDAQRPTAIGLFTLCYQLGGAFGPAIATALVLGR